jgi:hypothetical protein
MGWKSPSPRKRLIELLLISQTINPHAIWFQWWFFEKILAPHSSWLLQAMWWFFQREHIVFRMLVYHGIILVTMTWFALLGLSKLVPDVN